MIYCILSKIIALVLALYYYAQQGANSYILLFMFGILPIWCEVFTSWLLDIEPAKQVDSIKLKLDALVDIVVFIIAPALMFSITILENIFNNSPTSNLILLSLVIFISSGVFRIFKFLNYGLTDGKYFTGLPVTYTGYLWILLFLLYDISMPLMVAILLLIFANLMNNSKLKIATSR